MSINTNLKGLVNRLQLAPDNFLMPLFEAIVNSIQSIEEAKIRMSTALINIEVVRAQELALANSNDKGITIPVDAKIVGFRIIDNGVGFNQDNFDSFQMIATEHKVKLGCKGVGRLTWLKIFNKIKVESIYQEEDKYIKRNFDFNDKSGVENDQREMLSSIDVSCKTIVELIGIKGDYQKAIPKNIDILAKKIIEHCIWYYIREAGAPNIIISDGQKTHNLSDYYDELVPNLKGDSFKIGRNSFDVTHVKFYGRSFEYQNHMIFCAADRIVEKAILSDKIILGLSSKIRDLNLDSDGVGVGVGKEFTYSCFVTSKYFNDNVNMERTRIIFQHEYDLINDSEIELVTKEVVQYKTNLCSNEFLKEYLKERVEQGMLKVEQYVNKIGFKYKPILKRISNNEKYINPDASEKEIELKLHNHFYELEKEIISEGHLIMEPKIDEDFINYKYRLSHYLDKVEDVKQSDLASYITHRRVIIDIFRKALELQHNGKYSLEDVIHELIVPMRTDSTDKDFIRSNLWLIDERLNFHNYMASDLPLKKIHVSTSNSLDRPDLFFLMNNPLLLTDEQDKEVSKHAIVIVEFKRPMRNDNKLKSENPLLQSLRYLDQIKSEKLTDARGRPINNVLDIPVYCFVICDLTDVIKSECRINGYTETPDREGYFHYNAPYRAYLEVISYKKLVHDAAKRNQAFFDKLSLPIK